MSPQDSIQSQLLCSSLEFWKDTRTGELVKIYVLNKCVGQHANEPCLIFSDFTECNLSSYGLKIQEREL